MRADLVLISALLLFGPPSGANDSPDSEPSEDERAVLLATRGEPVRKPQPDAPVSKPAAPADLDGPELQAWFDHRYGASAPTLARPLEAGAADLSDAEAEAELLRRIERNRKP